MKARPLTLCYHAVSDSWEHKLAVRPATLLRHIKAVRAFGYRWGALDEASNGRRVAHLTFDDGYRSVLSIVPALRKNGIPATFFLPTGMIDGEFTAADLLDQPPEERRTLTWDDIRGLVATGFSIGSHTLSHQPLPDLSDGDLWTELSRSREVIISETGVACSTLSYPFGLYDGRVMDAAAEAGYRFCFALSHGEDGAYDLRRTTVFRQDGTARFLAKASGPGRSYSHTRLKKALDSP